MREHKEFDFRLVSYINEYMEVLDALFLLGKVGYDDVLGELYYVK